MCHCWVKSWLVMVLKNTFKWCLNSYSSKIHFKREHLTEDFKVFLHLHIGSRRMYITETCIISNFIHMWINIVTLIILNSTEGNLISLSMFGFKKNYREVNLVVLRNLKNHVFKKLSHLKKRYGFCTSIIRGHTFSPKLWPI